LVGVTVGGWVGPQASKLTSLGGWVGPQAGKRAQRVSREQASAPRSGAQPMIDYINLIKSYTPLENV
jgi:hypothetical protein